MSSLPPASSLPIPTPLYTAYDRYHNIKPIQQQMTTQYGNQNAFQKWKTDQVARMVAAFEKIKSEHYPNDFLEKQCLRLGTARNQIAKAMASDEWQNFGVERTAKKEPMLTDLLLPQYREANQRLRELFSLFFPLFQTEVPVHKVSFDTGLSRFTIEKIEPQKLQTMVQETQSFPNRKDYSSANDYFLAARQRLHQSFVTSVIIEVHETLRNIYPKLKLSPFEQPAHLPPSPLQYYVGTIETKEDQEWNFLTSYVLFKQKGKAQSDDLFNHWGYVSLVHTPYLEMETQLARINGLTKILTQYDFRKNPDQCKRILAEWEWRMYHVMRYIRGSAACTEVWQEALSQFQKLNLPIPKDMDAFCQPFLETYIRNR